MPCDTPAARVALIVHPPTRKAAFSVLAELAEMSTQAVLDGANDDCQEALSAIADEAQALLDVAATEGR